MSTNSNNSAPTIEQVLELAKYGFKLHPLDGKNPCLGRWQVRGTSDEQILRKWFEIYAGKNWGIVTGPASGILAVDIDPKNHGDESWEELVSEHGEPDTLKVKTGSDGYHYYFQYPTDGTVLLNSQDKIGKGIDTRGLNGNLVVPPSIHPATGQPYEWVNWGKDPAPIPEWLLDILVSEQPVPQEDGDADSHEGKSKRGRKKFYHPQLVRRALSALAPSRVENYDSWVRVGMALWSSYGDAGYDLWVEWSKKSSKQADVNFRKKWASFKTNPPAKPLTVATILKWADEDGSPDFVPLCPPDAATFHFDNAVVRRGYKVVFNTMEQAVEINGEKLSDHNLNLIMADLGDFGYHNFSKLQSALHRVADQHKYHPIADYFESLKWDGQEHIKKLGEYIVDQNGLFTTVMRKWFIGAVARVYSGIKTGSGEQNEVIVLYGDQGIGKSTLVAWLCPVPGRFIESAVNPDNKDHSLNLVKYLVWEIKELGATTRKADVEALKGWLTTMVVNERAPYARGPIEAPAVTSFIGTVNPKEEGLLDDPSGYRRFRVLDILSINHDYSKEIDIHQIWAEAVAAYKAGETRLLDSKDLDEVTSATKAHEVEDPLMDHILAGFDLTPDNLDNKLSSAEILRGLVNNGYRISEDKGGIMKLAPALTKLGLRKVMSSDYAPGKRSRVWAGIRAKKDTIADLNFNVAEGTVRSNEN